MNAVRIAASRRTPSTFVASMPPSTDAACLVCVSIGVRRPSADAPLAARPLKGWFGSIVNGEPGIRLEKITLQGPVLIPDFTEQCGRIPITSLQSD